MSGYQFHAVNVALEETLRAVRASRAAEPPGRYESGRQPGGEPGDRRVGVVWHTQGSGKSLIMAFYAGRVILRPAMANPTLVVLTDRNDLDDQLFGTFARFRDLLRQPRSLRLNFEYNLECYDRGLAARLDAIIDAKIAAARPEDRARLEGRALPARLRDGLTRLLSPYL